jgi:hypothetical protein
MKLPSQFINLIKDESARALLCDYTEIAIDGLTDDENLEKIPIVGTLTKGGKFILSFRDKVFIKKINSFLREAKEIDSQKKLQYFEELGDEDERVKAGERLLTLIDRLDDEEKAKIVGRLFRMRVEGTLSESWFSVITTAIEKTYFMEFHKLRAGARNPNILKNQVGEIFVPFRLVERKFDLNSKTNFKALDNLGEVKIEITYDISKIGKVLIKVLNEEYGELS